MSDDSPRAGAGRLRASPSRTPAAAASARSDHAAQFHPDEPTLVANVTRFAADGLRDGNGVLLIATTDHLDAIEREMSRQGIGIASARQQNRLVLRDARATAARFMIDGLPDEARFRAVLDELLAPFADGRGVRVYGEIVDVLLGEGKTEAVLRLEELWQAVVAERKLDLLCGYALGRFAGIDARGTRDAICERHDRVLPSERYASLSEPERLRAVAELEQLTITLEQEIEQRRRLERARAELHESERKARRESERRREEMERLFRLSQSANSAVGAADVYEPALDTVCSVLGVERAAILLFDPDGVIRFKAWRGLSDGYRAAVEGHSPWTRDTRDPIPVWVPDVRRDEALSVYGDLFVRERIGALGFIPMVQQGRLLGKFMVYAAEPRRFSIEEEQLALTIASEIAQAIARAELIDSERRARMRAELLANRASRLQQITAALSTAPTVAAVCEAVVHHGAAAIGAATGGLWLLDEAGRSAEMVSSLEFSAQVDRFRRIDLETAPAVPVADVLRSGSAIWIEGRAEFERRYPEVYRHATARPEMAIACMPMTVDGQALGALAFTFDELRPFVEDERNFLQVLASHCAAAVARARILEKERLARAEAEASQNRSAFLLEASIILSATLDFEESLRAVAALAVPRIADWCVVDVQKTPDAMPETLAIGHVDPAGVERAREWRRRFPLDPRAPRGPMNVIRTGTSELHPWITDEQIEAAARDEEHLRLLREVGLRSVMISPIAARGRSFGAITFVSSDPDRRFGPKDVELGELLGRRAGIAIDNAMLFEAANAATKARENILAVVSHDLRNPLSVVRTNAALLQNLELPAKSAARVRKMVDGIQRAGERMSRLIADLLDLGSLESGRLRMELAPCAPADIVEEVLDAFTPLAEERELRLESRVDEGLPAIDCDRDRVLQALGNFVSNAVKVTASKGGIEIGASRRGDAVRFHVRDTGPGVDPEELPHVFDLYWRSERIRYKGIGLGLAIARRIVDAHAGTIDVESTPGEGACFSFTLPIRAARREG